MSLEGFHPAVAAWFAAKFGEPTEPQGALTDAREPNERANDSMEAPGKLIIE